MDDLVKYHYCAECGDQLTVTDWGRGLCDACCVPSLNNARHIRLTKCTDMLDAARAKTKQAAKLMNHAVLLEPIQRKKSERTAHILITEAEELRERHKRLLEAGRDKFLTKGSDLTPKLFGPDDTTEARYSSRRYGARTAGGLNRGKQKPRITGNPRKSKLH